MLPAVQKRAHNNTPVACNIYKSRSKPGRAKSNDAIPCYLGVTLRFKTKHSKAATQVVRVASEAPRTSMILLGKRDRS